MILLNRAMFAGLSAGVDRASSDLRATYKNPGMLPSLIESSGRLTGILLAVAGSPGGYLTRRSKVTGSQSFRPDCAGTGSFIGVSALGVDSETSGFRFRAWASGVSCSIFPASRQCVLSVFPASRQNDVLGYLLERVKTELGPIARAPHRTSRESGKQSVPDYSSNFPDRGGRY